MFTFVERIAVTDPRRAAIVTNDVHLDYAGVVDRARRVAAALRARGIERVAVVDFEAPVVVPVLAGAEAAGVQACVYPPDDAQALADLARRFDHTVAISDRDDLAGVFESVVSSHDLFTTPPSEPAFPAVRPHLVLTTGTTGSPRGVRHDWVRLTRGTRHVQPGQGQRWLLAFGLHQFAGLQILLHVFAAGATLVAPAPRRPREGLAAMRAHAVTHASATPTYWRFLLAELRGDGGPVPALRQVTLGGETVPGPLLDDLRGVFGDAAISQVYAASEIGSTGSMRDARSGLSVDALDRGDDADVDLRVVDGELWARSRIGMLGYHGEPDLAPDAWRPTGDLVEIDGDRVVFRGRASEIINVGGVKVHPLPIEERISAVDGVDVVRVFGRPNPLTGSIVAAEIVAAPAADVDRIRADVRAACADLAAAERPRSIRFVDDVVTTGGKIIRKDPV